ALRKHCSTPELSRHRSREGRGYLKSRFGDPFALHHRLHRSGQILSTPPTYSDPNERRALAAIVFTDVVGFARHASRNEPAALAKLGSEFEMFREVCTRHGGTIENVAGDGMLMTFASGIEAMKCAVEIQAHVQRAAKERRPGELVFEHRIGVHVGDVIFRNEAVLGDGVNTAARLERMGRPGAVTFSRAVHEIIRGKYDPPGAKYLGPRQAKNLGEPLPVWEVPPPGELATHPMDSFTIPAPVPAGATGRKSALILMCVLILVGLSAASLTMLAVRPRPGGKSSLEELAGRGPRARPQPTIPAPSAPAAAPSTSEPAKEIAAPDAAELLRTVAILRQTYEFAAIAELLRNANSSLTAITAPLLERYSLLAEMRKWADAELLNVPSGTPLSADENVIFSDGQGVFIREGGKPDAPFNLWGQSPGKVLATLTALSLRPDLRQPAPARALETFATEYSLPTP
ncbi:MAG: hypothetical protein C4320_00240, partial [Armatimonadota bacterium]